MKGFRRGLEYLLGLSILIATITLLTITLLKDNDEIAEMQNKVDQIQRQIEQLDPEIDVEVIIPEDAIQIELQSSKGDVGYKTFEATAYTADCTGCIGITKTGVDVRSNTRHEGKRIIAVDPNIIPLGSVVELKLSDGTTFEASAEDTGAAIVGKRIDLLMGSREKAIQFGRQDIELRILRRGGPR